MGKDVTTASMSMEETEGQEIWWTVGSRHGGPLGTLNPMTLDPRADTGTQTGNMVRGQMSVGTGCVGGPELCKDTPF